MSTAADVPLFILDTLSTVTYTLSLHDALPICSPKREGEVLAGVGLVRRDLLLGRVEVERRVPGVNLDTAKQDRKSTRLNSSHLGISYAVFCLKKKMHGMFFT